MTRLAVKETLLLLRWDLTELRRSEKLVLVRRNDRLRVGDVWPGSEHLQEEVGRSMTGIPVVNNVTHSGSIRAY